MLYISLRFYMIIPLPESGQDSQLKKKQHIAQFHCSKVVSTHLWNAPRKNLYQQAIRRDSFHSWRCRGIARTHRAPVEPPGIIAFKKSIEGRIPGTTCFVGSIAHLRGAFPEKKSARITRYSTSMVYLPT